MELSQYIAIARRWWWLLALATVVGGLSAYGVSRLVTPTYRATTTLLVVQQQEPGTVGLSDLQASERLANTFSELVTVRPVLESAIARASLSLTPEELEERLQVTNPPTTQLLEISAEASTADAARDLANVVADAFIDSNQSALGNRPGVVSMVEAAQAPLEPSEPSPARNAVLGAFLALLVTAGIVALVEYQDDTVKGEEGVGELTGVPVIGHVGQFSRPTKPGEQLRTALGPTSREAEAYRSMRTNLNYTLGQSEGAKRLLVTSPGPGEGKSTTAANLAVVFGLAGARVAIVDADLRRPTQHRIFRIPNTSGLTNLLANSEMRIQDVVQRTAHERVWILPSGPIPANPSELLGSGRMDELLRAFETHFDIVILDTAPALAVTDPVILSSIVSATVVVVQQGKTRSAELKHAVQRLAVAGHPIAGVVINRVVGGQHGYYYADYESASTTPAESGQSGQSPRGQSPPLRPASAIGASGARGPLEREARTPVAPGAVRDVGETKEPE